MGGEERSTPHPAPPGGGSGGTRLLQEGDEAARAVLVRPRQVDVLEVEDEPVALARTEDAARRRRLQDAQLPDLLHDVLSGGLRGAVQRRRRRRAARLDEVSYEHGLARALGPDEQKRLHALHPRREERRRALRGGGAGRQVEREPQARPVVVPPPPPLSRCCSVHTPHTCTETVGTTTEPARTSARVSSAPEDAFLSSTNCRSAPDASA